MSSSFDITELLHAWASQDDAQALPRLMPQVVDELRRLARRYFADEAPGHTLQPTALVNEVYLRLAGRPVEKFESRAQFFAFAARLMREILVDHARARRTVKRGGGVTKLGLEAGGGVAAAEPLDRATLLAIDTALERLRKLDLRQVRIVELRYFAGLTLGEIADLLDLSLATVERSWSAARRWLAREIQRPA